MVEVGVSKRINGKKLNALFNFLFSISDQVCFSTFHNYKIDEDTSVEIINEYKERCKEKHHQLTKWYERKDPMIMKALKKFGATDENSFNEYKMSLFQSDMALCKKMEEVLEKLQEEEKTIDYKEVFPSIASSYLNIETHMFDSTSVSTIPLDLVSYKLDEEVKKVLLDMKSMSMPILVNKDKTIFYFNPLFCKGEDGFAIIYSQQEIFSMVISEEEYKIFKKLKIRHSKEEAIDESKDD